MTTKNATENAQKSENIGIFARVLRSLSLAGAWLEGGSPLMAGYSAITGPLGEPFFVPVVVEPIAEDEVSR